LKVLKYIKEKAEKEKLHFTLIDLGKQSPQKAAELALIAKKAGTDLIMIGGSDSVKEEKLNETVALIKKATGLYVVLFPSSAKYISLLADAILFMSLLNSKKIDYVIGKQVDAALLIKRINLEMISMGYLVIKPGMRVGKKSKVKLIKRRDSYLAKKYAVCAETFGMSLFYLEAGSGAPLSVPDGMIKEVKQEIDIPLIVGGGINDTTTARKKAEAGADIIVTGTILEEDDSRKGEKLARMIKAIKEVKQSRAF